MENVPALRGERAAGAVLHRLPALGAAFVLVCAVAAAVLAPLQLWRPWLALPVVVAGTALAARGLPGLPGLPGLLRLPACPVPVWSFGLSCVAAVGYAGWVAATHAEQVVIRRDAGSYALFGQWLATRGRVPVDVSLEAFGGAAALSDPHLGVGSAGFYGLHSQVGSADAAAWVVPQFLIGAPANLSVGWWLGQGGSSGGWTGLFLVPAVVGGLAVLALAALTSRVVGPRWAPLAAFTLALAQPVLHAGRGTYSEPFALLLTLVAGGLLYEAVAAPRGSAGDGRGPAWSAGLLAGAVVGLSGLVRVDALRELAFLLPVVALLWVCRHPAAGGLLRGLVAGALVSVTADVLLSGPYLREISDSLRPLGAMVAVLAVASAAIAWRRPPAEIAQPRAAWLPTADESAQPRPAWLPTADESAQPRPAWLPTAAGIAVLVCGLLLAARPLFRTVRQDPADPGARLVASLQAAQGLPVDGGRTYAEHTVPWVTWYLGPATVVLALLAAAEATRRAVRWWQGRTTAGVPMPVPKPVPIPVPMPPWLPLLFVGACSTVAVLWRPGITPDHPWADRRLVPVVLPFVVVCASAAVAWATREARRRLPATLLATVFAGGVAAMIVPAGLATWPVAGQRTERGELDGLRRVCAALRPGDAVIMVDVRAAYEWTQTVRGVCGVPTAVLRLSEAEQGRPRLPTVTAAVPALAERVAAAGRRPVLMAAEGPSPLLALGLQPREVLDARSSEDQKLLTRRPDGDLPLPLNVWLAPWDATKRAPTR